MIADGFHSLTDTAANVVGLIAMSVAQQPPDEDHPYGHRRFETLAALIIGGLLALVAWEVLKSCVDRLREGGEPQVSRISFIVMGSTMLISWFVSTWERREGEKHKSELLLADSEHTRSDILTSLAVVGSLIGARLGYPWLDLVAAAGITVIIGRTAFRILRDNSLLLADTALVPSDQIRRRGDGGPRGDLGAQDQIERVEAGRPCRSSYSGTGGSTSGCCSRDRTSGVGSNTGSIRALRRAGACRATGRLRPPLSPEN